MSDHDRAKIIEALNEGNVELARACMPLLRTMNGEEYSESSLVSLWSEITKQYVKQAEAEHKEYIQKFNRIERREDQADYKRIRDEILPDRWQLYCFYKQIRSNSSKALDCWLSRQMWAKLRELGCPFPRADVFGKLPPAVIQRANVRRAAGLERKEAKLFDIPHDETLVRAIHAHFLGLLGSADFQDVYVGLLYMSGRRQADLQQAFYEELPNGQVRWTNLAKNRGVDKMRGVIAPLLCSIHMFKAAYTFWHSSVIDHQFTPSQIREGLRKRVASSFVNCPALAQIAAGHTVNPHRLRELYVAIATKTVPHLESDARFIASILGDGISASLHYTPRTQSTWTL